MKKLFLALLAVGSIASANAQSNTILLYGDLSFNSMKDTGGNKHIQWHAAPGIGYQFNNNWTAGLNLAWGQDAYQPNGAPKVTDNMYMMGVFGRYSNAIAHSTIFSWYAQVDLSYQGGYTTSEGSPATNKFTGFYGDIFPAIAINCGHSLCLNFALGGLSYSTTTPDGASSNNNSFSFNFGQTYVVGLSKNFGCGHKMHGHHEPGDDMRHMKDSNGDDDAPKKSHKKSKDKDSDDDQ